MKKTIEQMRSKMSPKGKAVIASVAEVATMDLGDAAKRAETQERLEAVREAVAWRALDVATDPKTPQGEVRRAEELYHEMGVPLLGEDRPSSVEAETSLEAWIASARQALAEKFQCDPEAFEHITLQGEDGVITDVLVYTEPNGIDPANSSEDFHINRSWNGVMAADEKNTARHTVTIDGDKIDTRKAMTYELYEALIEVAKKEGRQLPDSNDNKLDNGWYTWTMMTGERAVGDVAPFAGVDDDGSVYRRWAYRDHDNRFLRVRPAVSRVRQ